MIESVTLINEETKKQVLLDMQDSDLVLKYAYFGPIDATHSSYKYPSQIGLSVTESSLGTREVEIIGYIIGNTEEAIKRRKIELSSFLNPLQNINAVVGEYMLQFQLSNTIEFSKDEKEDNEVLCKFGITGIAYDPLWKNKTENQVTAAGIINKFKFPLIISTGNEDVTKDKKLVFGMLQPSLIVAITNSGAVDTGMRIILKAKGTVVNPTIIDINTQKYFKINKTLEVGEEIEINTSVGKKTIIGRNSLGEEKNYYKYRDLKSSWLQLSRGDNLLRYSADSNGDLLEVKILYNNEYIDVV